jgi:hypothetical protein
MYHMKTNSTAYEGLGGLRRAIGTLAAGALSAVEARRGGTIAGADFV